MIASSSLRSTLHAWLGRALRASVHLTTALAGLTLVVISHAAEIDDLMRIHAAASKVAFAGSFVVQQGSNVQSWRIQHWGEGVTEKAVVEVLDGKARESLRMHDEVRHIFPDRQLVIVEKQRGRTEFPALPLQPGFDISEHYVVKRIESKRIAGYEAQGYAIDPKDKHRYGYRIWAERDSHLLLKSQIIGDKQDVLEQVGFSDLRIHANGDDERFKQRWTHAQGWRVEQMVSEAVPADQAQWVVKDHGVPGFRLLAILKRVGHKAASVAHMKFSDGLAVVSVFIEPAEIHKGTQQGASQMGCLSVFARRLGNYWVTAMGEVPTSTIRAIAQAIELR